MEAESDELGEDQALLILYLAGELSEEQHSNLERRLATDESLRRELEALRAAQAMIWREMLAADSTQPLKGVMNTAHRKLAGMVREWAVQRLAKEPAAVSRYPMRWWVGGLAAAAAIAIASMIYFGWSTDSDNAIMNRNVDAMLVEVSNEPAPADDLFVHASLNEVEQELDAVAQLRTLTQ